MFKDDYAVCVVDMCIMEMVESRMSSKILSDIFRVIDICYIRVSEVMISH